MSKEETLSAVGEAMKALNAAYQSKFEPIPEGWFTAQQWAEQEGIDGRSARRRILDGIKMGIFERKSWKVLEHGKVSRVFIARVKPQ